MMMGSLTANRVGIASDAAVGGGALMTCVTTMTGKSATQARLVVTIATDLPADASPNSSKGKWATYRARKFLREVAYYSTVDVRPTVDPSFLDAGHWVCTITVGWGKGRKRMDKDNALSSCKGLIDGVSLALGIDDKNLTFAPVVQERDPDGIGWTRVELTEADEDG